MIATTTKSTTTPTVEVLSTNKIHSDMAVTKQGVNITEIMIDYQYVILHVHFAKYQPN